MRCRLPAVGANSTQAPGSKTLAWTAFPGSGWWVVVKRPAEEAAEAGDDGPASAHGTRAANERASVRHPHRGRTAGVARCDPKWCCMSTYDTKRSCESGDAREGRRGGPAALKPVGLLVQAAALDAVAAATKARSSTRPSSEPRRAELARSGWGISPTTFPASLAMPAMASTDPLGFSA